MRCSPETGALRRHSPIVVLAYDHQWQPAQQGSCLSANLLRMRSILADGTSSIMVASCSLGLKHIQLGKQLHCSRGQRIVWRRHRQRLGQLAHGAREALDV